MSGKRTAPDPAQRQAKRIRWQAGVSPSLAATIATLHYGDKR